MKKFLLTVAVASLMLFGGQTNIEAASVDNLNKPAVETQEVSSWPKIRDALLGRHKHDRHYRGDDRYDRRYDRHGRHYRDRDRRYDRRHEPPPRW